MGIISLTVDKPGQIGSFLGGVAPRKPAMVTTDSLATITTAGYLNPALKIEAQNLLPTDVMDVIYSASAQAPYAGTYGQFTVSISNGVITLSSWANPGDVLLPVTSGDFAVFNGTSGQIKDSGYAPSNAAKTTVVMANGTTIANHIATYSDTAGTISEDAATAINLGNIQAGDDTTKGQLIAYGGSLNGHVIINPIGNTGNTAITIQNEVFGQATVLTYSDPGTAAANILISDSGTKLMKSVAQAAVAGGAAAQTVTDAFCTTGSMVTASWNDTTNAVTIQKVAAGNGSFVVTSSGDPGASHLNYIITK